METNAFVLHCYKKILRKTRNKHPIFTSDLPFNSLSEDELKTLLEEARKEGKYCWEKGYKKAYGYFALESIIFFFLTKQEKWIDLALVRMEELFSEKEMKNILLTM